MSVLNNIKNNIQFYLISLIAFAIPLEKRVLPSIIALYVIHFVFSGGLKEKWRKIRENKYIWVTSGYYLALIIGCLWSTNVDSALFDLEVKFSLLLFPLMFVSLELTKRQFDLIIAWFIAGCFLAFVICLSYAGLYFYSTQDASLFYYDKLSVFHHPSYFSMYMNFAILMLYNYLIFDKDSFVINNVAIYVLIIVLFSLFVVLLSSKLGLISLLLIIFFGTLFWFLKSRAIFPSIMVFTMLTTLIYFSFKYSAIIQDRIQEAYTSLSKEEQAEITTTQARLIIWEISSDMALKHPIFGYGTGDTRDLLTEQYGIRGYDLMHEQRLNAHNQYFQMLLSLGLIGLTILMLYLYYPLRYTRSFENLVYLGFIALISLNFLVESMMETQAGVVFYAFFNVFLYFNQDKVAKLKL